MIRPARHSDAANLTKLSFRSKGYWNYPAHYFETWKEELTITSRDIDQKIIFVHENREPRDITGYYSLVLLEKDLVFSGGVLESGWWLEHMFVDPACIGKQCGTRLFHHMRETGIRLRIESIDILADPHARGFYEKMGCTYLGEYASSIPGRTTPRFLYHVQPP